VLVLFDVNKAPEYQYLDNEKENETIEKEYGIGENSIIYCCIDKETKLMEKIEEVNNSYQINYEFNEKKYITTIDYRKTMNDLKIEISKAIGMETDDFLMCNNKFKNPYQDMNIEISKQTDLFDGCSILIEKGKVLKKGNQLPIINYRRAFDKNI
jgi:hypothetical protein